MCSTHLDRCIERQLSREELRDIIDKAKDWALMHGITMRSKRCFDRDQVEIAPFTLLPSTFNKTNFEKVKNLQKILNELVHKVAYDSDFIRSNLRSTIEADSFTAKLFDIYNAVYAEGLAQTISIGLLRSDYMLHGDDGKEIKQIELNTVAASFAGIGTMLSLYHKYILMELGYGEKLMNVPENHALTGFCKGLIKAWSLYNNKEAVILFVVEDVTYNICDQRFHEFEICRLNPDVKIIRKSLSDLITQIELGPNKELKVGNTTVAVVYFRSGYQLEAYPTDKEWSVRLIIERSKAIKCPSIQYHLAGTKKVQQALAQPGVLERFISDPNNVAKVREVFAGLYSLDLDDEGNAVVAMALREPTKFVLKPQREGGGNNIYGENVRAELIRMKDTTERTGWILMERIHPPLQKNYLIRAKSQEDDFALSDIVSELGIYGVIIGDHTGIVYNEEVGQILRTKPSTENEGGIVQGVGTLDSPYLIT